MNKNSINYIGGIVIASLMAYLFWQNHEQQKILSQMNDQPLALVTDVDKPDRQQNDSVDQQKIDRRLDKIETALIRTVDKLKEISDSQKQLDAQVNYQKDGLETEQVFTKTDQIFASKPSVQDRQELIRQRINRFESNLTDNAEVDEVWTNTTIAMIDDKFASMENLQVAESKNVSCSNSVCKVETVVSSDATADAKQSFEFQMLLAFSNELPGATTLQETLTDGSTKYIHYYARKGYSID